MGIPFIDSSIPYLGRRGRPGERRTENGTRGKRATDEGAVQAALAAVLLVLYVLYVLPRRQRLRVGEPQISQILADFWVGYRRQDAQWKFRSLEGWKFGQASRYAAITVQAQRAKPSTAKDTKIHKGHKGDFG